jgi:plasmid stabilization system protein ParE
MHELYRIIISPEASADLESIHAYIAQDSPAGAARMVERILAAIDTLKSFPHRTLAEHVSARLRGPVRSLSVRPYVVYFRTLEDERVVRILTVRHGARRRPRRL